MMTTKRTKAMLLAATGLMAAMICAPALAQAQDKPAAGTETAPDDDVIVVKGLKKSLQSAADKKKKAAQISDTIVAEDVGKLPDNNVVEALSRVTGIQVERARGEGSGLKIRGMGDVQTTLNGSPNNSGVDRSASLNDIPAELLKSVTVYKTRTADQVEGGIAGTVNVDLRRPLDLPKGWTFAGSARNVYSDVGSTESPYFSGLIANRWSLSKGGELGFLINASYQEVNYNEQYVESETPRTFWGDQLNSLSTANKNVVAPYKVRFGIERGKVRRPSINAAAQWRVNENLDFVLEGSAMNAKENRAIDVLEARLKDSNAVITNLVYMPDGRSMKSATFTGTDLPVGPFANDQISDTSNSRINFEGHWRDENLSVNASIYRDENKRDMKWFRQQLRLAGLTTFNVDLDSSKTSEGGPYVEYVGVNLANVGNYFMREIETGKNYEYSDETVFAADITQKLSDDKLLRSVQIGVRVSDRSVEQAYGYRYAGFSGTRSVLLTAFPGGANGYESVSVDVPGYQSPSWYRLSREAYTGSFEAIRAYAADPTKQSYGGGGGFGLGPTAQWATTEVPTERMMGSFESSEKTSALFAQVFYGFDVGNIPVDGVIGGRSTRTRGSTTTARRVIDPVLGEIMVPATTTGDYTDFLPSVNGIIHFTPKLQLRLAYTKNVQRPNFTQSSSFVFLVPNTTPGGIGSGWGGNDQLKANVEQSYDASLEYYFGRGGVVSFATYLKKPDGFIYDQQEREVIDGLTYDLWRPRNAGPGEFQGYEFNAQGFFDFLPGKWANFGAAANFTYNETARIEYPYDDATVQRIGPRIYDAIGNSKYTYNFTLYYDTPQLSARLAYNYRDRFRAWADLDLPEYSPYVEPTSRLDAAINYTPLKQLTLSVEATNLLNNNQKTVWGEQALIPQGVRVQAKTIQVSARFRY